MQALLDDGISTRRGVMNAHLSRPIRQERGVLRRGTVSNEAKKPRTRPSPLFHDLDEGDQDRVIDAVTRAVSAHE